MCIKIRLSIHSKTGSVKSNKKKTLIIWYVSGIDHLKISSNLVIQYLTTIDFLASIVYIISELLELSTAGFSHARQDYTCPDIFTAKFPKYIMTYAVLQKMYQK